MTSIAEASSGEKNFQPPGDTDIGGAADPLATGSAACVPAQDVIDRMAKDADDASRVRRLSERMGSRPGMMAASLCQWERHAGASVPAAGRFGALMPIVVTGMNKTQAQKNAPAPSWDTSPLCHCTRLAIETAR
jgi:hypothetical protein